MFLAGGSGSFGQAFTKRALADGARKVVIYSRGEFAQAQMRAKFPDPRLRFVLGDVRDSARLEWAMAGCDIVIHAAAMKRVEQCEADPTEAVATNVQGTINVAQQAIRAQVQRAVFLSTDKAPIPSTLYGQTKAVAERCWIRSNVFVGDGPTRLNAVRYGNVIGSRGSVLALFRAQQAANLPLTLTSEAMTRFWMTLDQSVEIVLMALRLETGGSILVPKVPSASILTFAQAVVGPAVYAPGHVVTGLRPGERLHETLIADHEAPLTTSGRDFYQIYPDAPSWGFAPQSVSSSMVRVVPDFRYTSDTNPRQVTAEQLRELIA